MCDKIIICFFFLKLFLSEKSKIYYFSSSYKILQIHYHYKIRMETECRGKKQWSTDARGDAVLRLFQGATRGIV